MEVRTRMFMYSVECRDVEWKACIFLYGISNTGATVCVAVSGWSPSALIELTTPVSREAIRALRDIRGILSVEPVQLKRLYYNTHCAEGSDVTFTYLRIHAERKYTLHQLVRSLEAGTVRANGAAVIGRVHELNVSPALQFCVDIGVTTTGWVDITGRLLERKGSLSHVLSAKASSIRQTESPPPPPRPVVLAFDIEAYSSVPSRMPGR
jgi:DNA polymerase family B, exonuclease domain